jgi:hypothetical protein
MLLPRVWFSSRPSYIPCKKTCLEFMWLWIEICRPSSSVGIATGFGLNGSEIKSRWGRDFPHLSRPAPAPPSLLYNGYRVFPGRRKQPGVWRWPPHPILVPWSKNRVKLHLYSPEGPSWPVKRVNISLTETSIVQVNRCLSAVSSWR